MAHPIFAFEASVELCTAEFYLNDIPLIRLNAAAPRRAVIPVNEFLTGGRNLVEIVAHPGPTPAAARQGSPPLDDAGARALARIVRYPPNAIPGEDAGDRYLHLAWRSEARAVTSPAVAAQSVALDLPAGRWSWERADVLELTPATVAEVRGMIHTVQGWYRARDFDRLLAFKRLGLAEWAAAYGESAAAHADRIRRVLDEHLWNAPDWSVEDVDLARYDLRLCAGGRLVDCIAKDWLPIVRAGDGGSRFAMRIGRLGGEWHHLR